MFKKEGFKSKVISTEKLYIESKTIHVDFKENNGGRFLQIAEISNDRKSTVVIPSSGIGAFLATLQKVAGDLPNE
ncbi:MAG TPA: hypothetical protein VFF54_04180 [Thermodesulfobacteriota bacterium]|nr:hypothetical protein [Thermodesulfobacteriota bacterium]